MNDIDKDYLFFADSIFDLTDIQLSLYKENQMKRRIDTLIERNGYRNYENYINLLRTDEKILKEFLNFITINVSEFYRNPEQWIFLHEFAIPKLIQKYGNNLRIWSSACSTGEEPYTLAMCLSDYLPLEKIKIMATDINENVIEKAKKGVYDESKLKFLPEIYKKKYFKQKGSFYILSNDIKKCVKFSKLDLLSDEYPKECNLIICRNVLIYFRNEAKQKICRKFYESLLSSGCLFMGTSEYIVNYKELDFKKIKTYLYEK